VLLTIVSQGCCGSQRSPEAGATDRAWTDRAAKAQERDARDRKNQRPAHIHIDRDVYDAENDVHVRPTGNSTEAALRRLRKDRPDMGWDMG
jgi:hypothetical protein